MIKIAKNNLVENYECLYKKLNKSFYVLNKLI